MSETHTGWVKTAFLFACGCLIYSVYFRLSSLLLELHFVVRIICSGNYRNIVQFTLALAYRELWFIPSKCEPLSWNNLKNQSVGMSTITWLLTSSCHIRILQVVFNPFRNQELFWFCLVSSILCSLFLLVQDSPEPQRNWAILQLKLWLEHL